MLIYSSTCYVIGAKGFRGLDPATLAMLMKNEVVLTQRIRELERALQEKPRNELEREVELLGEQLAAASSTQYLYVSFNLSRYS